VLLLPAYVAAACCRRRWLHARRASSIACCWGRIGVARSIFPLPMTSYAGKS